MVTLDGLDPLLLRSFGIDSHSDQSTVQSTVQSPGSSGKRERHLVVQSPLDEEQQLRAELLSQQATAAAVKAKLRCAAAEQVAPPTPAAAPHALRAVGELPISGRAREPPVRGILKRPASPIVFDEPTTKKGSYS